jgi:hypothetical protein
VNVAPLSSASGLVAPRPSLVNAASRSRQVNVAPPTVQIRYANHYNGVNE